MLMIAMICMLVATIVLAVGSCFFNKNKSLTHLLQTFAFIALLCLGLVAANYKNNFSGYSILLILSITPQFLNLFDLKGYLKAKQEAMTTEKESEEEQPATPIIEEETTENEEKPAKKEKKQHFLHSNGTILQSLSLALSSFCVSFGGLYLGLETFYGFLIGLAVASALTFLVLILKKSLNPYDLLSYFLTFLAIGLLIGNMIIVILYSFSLINILYCAGALIFCGYIILNNYVKGNYDEIIYFIAMFCLICTLIV